MIAYQIKMREAWRLELLKLLASMPGYESGQYFLYECLRSGELPPPSADQVATELAWLNEQGLVKVVESAGLANASITQRGLDVAQGIVITPGVARPRPESE